jgi:hypothetical protein
MIETHWWDSLIILFVRYESGRVEVRVGVFCLLLIVVVVWKAVRAFLDRGTV